MKINQNRVMLYLWCLLKCIKPYLNISCFDVCVLVCCRFDFLRFVLTDVKKQAYMLERIFKTQQLQLLCDHHELACTPKDPLRRVNMKEMSFRSIHGTIYWVIDNTVSEPTLVTPTSFAPIIDAVTVIACCNRNWFLKHLMVYCKSICWIVSS